MIQVFATDRAGQEHQLQAPVGTVLMELLRDSGLGVEAVCGGCCACATCHIYIMGSPTAPLLAQRGDVESALVGSTDAFREDESRLSCQIELGPQLNNLRLQIASED